mgnify:CR=1 FL=1
MIRVLLTSIFFGLAAVTAANAQEKPQATLYRNPNCDFCLEYAKYLSANGFEVTDSSNQHLSAIRKQRQLPEKLAARPVITIVR